VKPSQVRTLIERICGDTTTTFKKKTDLLFATMNSLSRDTVLDHVESAGVIPESYSHDSSEEKLFAKYCDFLLAKAFGYLGLKAAVIEERADAADVIAQTTTYSLVGDAKAFRLSRTAKNQKDFKIEALNQWKRDANYACLVCPLYQYPTKTSQIYEQAIRYNVTLLSFTHLGFMMKARKIDAAEFAKIWTVSRAMPVSKEAAPYWTAISHQVTLAAGRSTAEWEAYLFESKKILREQAKAQLDFWESEKERIRNMDHDQAVEALIAVLRIDSNISMIARTIADLDELILDVS
jgi:hypothetical protein